MRKILTLLVASTALTAAMGVPAWSAMRDAADESPRPLAAPSQDGAHAMPLVLASDDDGNRGSSRRGDEDDDEDDEDDEDDDEDDDDEDGGSRGGASNSAPAGMVPPPPNGLFGNGAPPQVQVN
jgi:hypothetical protein